MIRNMFEFFIVLLKIKYQTYCKLNSVTISLIHCIFLISLRESKSGPKSVPFEFIEILTVRELSLIHWILELLSCFYSLNIKPGLSGIYLVFFFLFINKFEMSIIFRSLLTLCLPVIYRMNCRFLSTYLIDFYLIKIKIKQVFFNGE